MRCLFLPDNLFALLIEEQGLFQKLTTLPFRKVFPIFKTDNNFESIKIYPPIAIKGYIVRPCNFDPLEKRDEMAHIEGFVLGRAGERSEELIGDIPHLKSIARNATFEVISAKSWYFADVRYKKTKDGIIWQIGKKQWSKASGVLSKKC